MPNGNVLESWQETAIAELNKAIAAIQNDDPTEASILVEKAQSILDGLDDDDDEEWDEEDEEWDDDDDDDWDELDEEEEDE